MREIGRRNELPWHLPEDLAHFKETTLGSPVIMGRQTFESLPSGALPGRLNIVLSRSKASFPTVEVVASLEQALVVAGRGRPARAFVIGGGAVYEAALPVAETLFITHVDQAVVDADAFAPNLPPEFELVESEGWKTSRVGPRYRFERWSARR